MLKKTVLPGTLSKLGSPFHSITHTQKYVFEYSFPNRLLFDPNTSQFGSTLQHTLSNGTLVVSLVRT